MRPLIRHQALCLLRWVITRSWPVRRPSMASRAMRLAGPLRLRRVPTSSAMRGPILPIRMPLTSERLSSRLQPVVVTVVGVRTLTFIIPTPRAAVTSVVTVTNSGTGPLQITAENFLVNIGGLYSVPAALNTCSFTTPLAAGGTCTFSVTYATPAARPGFPDIGALALVNDGSGTMGGSTPLALIAQ